MENNNYYKNYHKFQDKTQEEYSRVLFRYYTSEIDNLKISKNSKCLEIGFGNCDFLNYCKNNNIDIVGYEINQYYYDKALEKGYNVLFGDIIEIDIKDKYDFIFLFDVLEHIPKNKILSYFQTFHEILNPNGKIFIRCPNGSSPFGLIYQNGDLTHETFLNEYSLEQICGITNFDFIECRNPKYLYNPYSFSFIIKIAIFTLRRFIELFIGLIFVGKKLSLDPNLIAILKKL